MLPAPQMLSTDYPAGMQLDQFLNQRQSDAGALVGAALHSLDPVKTLKKHGSSFSGMLQPVSWTDNTAAPSATPTCTAMPPSNVYLKALETRLRTISPTYPDQHRRARGGAGSLP